MVDLRVWRKMQELFTTLDNVRRLIVVIRPTVPTGDPPWQWKAEVLAHYRAGLLGQQVRLDLMLELVGIAGRHLDIGSGEQ